LIIKLRHKIHREQDQEMIFQRYFHIKSKAQAMVEFAIALPILLLLLYGLLEAGRLLFMYSTVVTASRQAVRYGATTGLGNNNVPRYQDCTGIRGAASRVAFLGPFDSINIYYDTGGGDNPYCAGTIGNLTPSQLQGNKTRLVVTVREEFYPLVPRLVPFAQRTISATSRRTILYSVPIVVEDPGGGWGGTGGSGVLTLSVTPTPTTYDSAGQIINFSYLVTNIGTGDIITPITINDSKASASCSGAPAVLVANGGSHTCYGTYTITQADVDAGSVTFQTTASASGTSSPQVNSTITAIRRPGLTLAKTPAPSATSIVSTDITYTYTLTNTGNVTLTSPFTLTDNKLGNVSCPSTNSLAPNAVLICTTTYKVKQQDIDAKSIVNIATATARFGTQTITSNQATAIVYTPALFLTVTYSPLSITQANQVITYTYTLQNLSRNDLTSPYTVTDSRVTSVNCSGARSPLPTNESTTCTGTYTVTQTDLDTLTTLTSTVVATARDRNQTRTSNDVSVSVPLARNPALSLQVVASPTTATTLNDRIAYTYTLTNTGNVTLSPPFTIVDNKASNITCSSPTSALAPGATKTCTGERIVSQTDLDAGSITNQATASAVFAGQTVSSSQQSVTVTTFVGPRLKLQITPNPSSVYAGDTVTYLYTLTNTGSVTLSGPFTVTDSKAGTADCSSASASLAVGASTTCFASYTTTPGDVGTLTNTATAGATYEGTPISATASATVTVSSPSP
jgi:plastocyanin